MVTRLEGTIFYSYLNFYFNSYSWLQIFTYWHIKKKKTKIAHRQTRSLIFGGILSIHEIPFHLRNMILQTSSTLVHGTTIMNEWSRKFRITTNDINNIQNQEQGITVIETQNW